MRRNGVTVLGIDAAWTDGQPSGVALVQRRRGRWKCLGLAPSYASFCHGLEWGSCVKGGRFDARVVLEKCSALACETPQVVAVDMPLSTQRIVGRRAADTEVSRRFGHRNCSTHSPNAERPGRVGRRFYDAFIRRKFRLVTAGRVVGPSLLEVYPHPALLGLMQAEDRVPYKVSRRSTYWPDEPSAVWKQLLVEQWHLILAELRARIDGIEFPLPDRPEELKFAALKPFEDALDALICAWVGIEFAEKRAAPLGNATAAIWVPSSSMPFTKSDGA